MAPPFVEQLESNVYGCDICQDVCPWNRKPIPPDRAEFQPRAGLFHPELSELASLSEADFERRFAGSPIERRGRSGLQAVVKQVRDRQPE